MSDEDYNGWSNWATWYVSSELSNNFEWNKKLERLVRTEAPAEDFEKLARESLFPSGATTYGEMSLAKLEDVNWNEIRDTEIAG